MKRPCVAHRTDGEPCQAQAIKGGSVCRVHGGSIKRVKDAAARRLLQELVGPALAELRKIVENPKTPPAVKLAAVRDILDRTGYGATRHVEVVTLDLVDAEIRRLESELGLDPRPLHRKP